MIGVIPAFFNLYDRVDTNKWVNSCEIDPFRKISELEFVFVIFTTESGNTVGTPVDPSIAAGTAVISTHTVLSAQTHAPVDPGALYRR